MMARPDAAGQLRQVTEPARLFPVGKEGRGWAWLRRQAEFRMRGTRHRWAGHGRHGNAGIGLDRLNVMRDAGVRQARRSVAIRGRNWNPTF